MKSNLLALCGAIGGGIVGYLIYWWCLRQGYSALALPGGLVGLGAGIFRSKSIAVCILCGCAALMLGILCEWHFFPFIADDGLGYFLAHFFKLSPMTLLMIGVGGFIGFWIPFRRIADAK